jgi:NosR/NirI family transcriptional regulator, nitrous oxide reductase regulator
MGINLPASIIRVLLAAVWILAAPAAGAGTMTHEELARHFPSPLIVLEKDRSVPVWPIIKQNGPQDELVAYVFESMDLAPIPGFSGTPFNLLIALAPSGEFLEVRVLSQHEPVFLDGLGPDPLFAFVAQYGGVNLRQNIKIGSNLNKSDREVSTNVYLDGVAKATASVKIVNETVLASALKVARAKLGYAQGRDPSLAARVRTDVFEPMTWAQLIEKGWIRRLRLTNREVEAAYAGTATEGVDEVALRDPDGTYSDLYAAYLNVPTVGRSLLGDAGYARLMGRLEDGQHALWIMSAGRYQFVSEDFVRGAVPDRLGLQQGGLPLDLRDMDVELMPTLAGVPRDGVAKFFKVFAQAGLDPASPWRLSLRVTRERGQFRPEKVSRDFALDYALPKRFFVIPEDPGGKPWVALWKSRAWELTLLAISLGILTVALARQRQLAADPRRLAWFRWSFLAFTLLFVGWYAQAQLSIVTITGAIRTALATRDFSFLLYDPASLVLWAFSIVTLFVWGRGTFCGWLCPFGALQEFVAAAAKRLRVPQLRIPEGIDRWLVRAKYVVLVALLGSAAAAPALADRLAEVEPFKTAITLVFVRSWPFVAWAVATLLLGAFVYKGFCRWICPLGAALAAGGTLRLLRWIPRRAECGAPCQLCRHRCEYKAIERSGAIRYDECFQCLDCVGIYHDAARCAPLLLESRKGRKVVPIKLGNL